jgi:hypothetical protein
LLLTLKQRGPQNSTLEISRMEEVRHMALKERLKSSFSWLWNSVLKSESQWKEVHISTGIKPGPTIRRHSHLRAHGIRCKLLYLNNPVGMRGGGTTRMVSLRVHKDDMVKARQLMNEVRD